MSNIVTMFKDNPELYSGAGLPNGAMAYPQEIINRRSYIGGTTIRVLVGKGYKNESTLTEYNRIVNGVEQDLAKGSFAIREGAYNESFIIEEYQRDYLEGDAVVFRSITVKHPKFSFLGAQIDGLVQYPDGSISIIEAKSSGSYGGIEGSFGSQMPERYRLQAAWQRFITDAKHVDVVVKCGVYGIRIARYTKDDILEDSLFSIASNFWHQHIEKRIPPRDIKNEDSKRDFVTPQGSINVDNDIADVVEEMKAADEKCKTLKSYLQELMGDREVMVCNGKILATWKARGAERFDSTKFRQDNPELYQKYIKHSVSRYFLTR